MAQSEQSLDIDLTFQRKRIVSRFLTALSLILRLLLARCLTLPYLSERPLARFSRMVAVYLYGLGHGLFVDGRGGFCPLLVI